MCLCECIGSVPVIFDGIICIWIINSTEFSICALSKRPNYLSPTPLVLNKIWYIYIYTLSRILEFLTRIRIWNVELWVYIYIYNAARECSPSAWQCSTTCKHKDKRDNRLSRVVNFTHPPYSPDLATSNHWILYGLTAVSV